MPKRLRITLVCLHISAVLYILVGLALFFALSEDRLLGAVLGMFCLLLTMGVEVVVLGLKRSKFWAWVLAVVICGVYVPSLYLALGALGLWGLLAAESRALFLRSAGTAKGSTA